ncbi:MAG TPA: HD domain-containing phosphohydrolase [Nitrospiria bacterium]
MSAANPTDGLKLAEHFLRMLTKTLRDRTLYPKNHPQLIKTMEQLGEVLPALFQECDKRTFAFIEDQIYIDDCLMTTLDQGPSDIIRIFHDRLIEILILREGLTLPEISSLVDFLSSPFNPEEGTFSFQSLHIELGKLGLDQSKENTQTPLTKDLEFAISKSVLNTSKFSEESRALRDIYMDWNTAQDVLMDNVNGIMQGLERALFNNFNSFIPFIELKSYDEYTHVHAINLSILTMAQAQSLGFSKEAIHAFGMGALLHDVGKTQVSVKVLHKDGKLTDEEFAEMQRHPLEGAMLLLQYPEVPKIAAIVAYEHHLKYNCKGYPTMKQERPQHIASRLTAISDQFDAMRSNRPYRAAMEAEKIIGIMQENKGTDLDPILVDHFIGFIKSRRVM